MSLMDEFNPKRVRQRRSEPNPSKTNLMEEVRIIPDAKKDEPKPEPVERPDELIEQYRYKPEEDQMIISEHNKVLENNPASSDNSDIAIFDLYDLSFLCEEHLRIKIQGPINTKTLQVYQAQKDLIQRKLEIYADGKETIELKNFKDSLFRYKTQVLIPEELYRITGFLREFFKIKKVMVLYDTGEIIEKDTLFCGFWLDKIEKFFERKIYLKRPETMYKDACYECNFDCEFRYRKQMDN